MPTYRQQEIQKDLYEITLKYFYGCDSIEEYREQKNKVPTEVILKMESLQQELKDLH